VYCCVELSAQAEGQVCHLHRPGLQSKTAFFQIRGHPSVCHKLVDILNPIVVALLFL